MTKPVKGVSRPLIIRKADPHGPKPIPMPLGNPSRPAPKMPQGDVEKARKHAAEPITRKPS